MQRFSFWRAVGSQPFPTWLAPAVEQAGFHRLWIGGAVASLENVEQALAATSTLTFASGVANIWREDAAELAASFHRLEERHPGRFLLGIGTGHPERTAEYTKPYEAISRYLDALDEHGVPIERRVLAALGPRMLRLARDRSAGAHPYLVPPAHTAEARAILGPDKLLAPEHKVVLGTDPEAARTIARPRVQEPYLGLTNYRSNLKRLGFTDADLDDGGSDALLDAVVAHGTADEIATEVGRHLEAGADEVAVQLLSADPAGDATAEIAELGRAFSRWEAAH